MKNAVVWVLIFLVAFVSCRDLSIITDQTGKIGDSGTAMEFYYKQMEKAETLDEKFLIYNKLMSSDNVFIQDAAIDRLGSWQETWNKGQKEKLIDMLYSKIKSNSMEVKRSCLVAIGFQEKTFTIPGKYKELYLSNLEEVNKYLKIQMRRTEYLLREVNGEYHFSILMWH